MASQHPISKIPSAITPRPKRAPREKLSYLKCTFCRKAKVKCLPDKQRRWPHEKCIRCISKKLECSAPQQASVSRDSNSLQLHTAIRIEHDYAGGLDKSNDRSLADDALTLLSIQHMLQVAIEEMHECLTEAFLPLQEHRLGTLLRDLTAGEDEYDTARTLCELIKEIKIKLKNEMPPSVHVMLLEASQDLAFMLPTRTQSYLGSGAATKGHRSFAYVLQLSKVRRGGVLELKELQTLRLNRRAFSEGWSEAFKAFDLHKTTACGELEDTGVNLMDTQFLTPKGLLKIPSILEDVREDGRMDILGRSVAHVMHDAGIREPWPESALFEEDRMGHSSLHLACIRKDSALLKQCVANEPMQLNRPGHWFCFSPIAYAVIHGYLEPLVALREHDEDVFREAMFFQDFFEFASMHLAAAAGQVNIVQYLLEHLETFDLIYAKDDAGRLPCHYAAEAGHLEMLDLLLAQDYSSLDRTDIWGHSLMWYAQKGGHANILERLNELEKEYPPSSPLSTSSSDTST